MRKRISYLHKPFDVTVPGYGVAMAKTAVWRRERTAKRTVSRISSSVSVGKPIMKNPPQRIPLSTVRSIAALIRETASPFFITRCIRAFTLSIP
jgi:hypothetical protein